MGQAEKITSINRRLLLRGETVIPHEDLKVRSKICQAFSSLPSDVFGDVHFIQPIVNCLNGCQICAEHAGKNLIQLPENSLKNLVAGLKACLLEKFPERANDNLPLVGFSKTHKQGYILDYFNNDSITTYDMFDLYIKLLNEELGVKIRTSTSGISAKNERLLEMHQRISDEMSDKIAGLRISVTPFNNDARRLSRDDSYLNDLTATLKAYRHFIETKTTGKTTNCANLRFVPNIQIDEQGMTVENIGNWKIIKCGDYRIVTNSMQEIPLTKLLKVDGRIPVYDHEGIDGWVVLSEKATNADLAAYLNELQDPINSEKYKKADIGNNDILIRSVKIFRFENEEGEYYGTDPARKASGAYDSIQLYPQTEKRRKAGVIDSTRYLLQAQLDFRESKDKHDPKERLTGTSWEDVNLVVKSIESYGEAIRKYSSCQADYILKKHLPLVKIYAEALQRAGLSPDFFFDLNFTRDTGGILNMGRATPLFKGLVSKADVPVTPVHEKNKWLSTNNGRLIRIFPNLNLRDFNPDNGEIKVVRMSEFWPDKPDELLIIQGIKLRHISADEGRELNLRV